jgi:hypothetical protein
MPILFFDERASDKKLRKLMERRNLTPQDNPGLRALDKEILEHINIMPLDPERRQALKEALENNQDDEDYFNLSDSYDPNL